MFKRLNESPRLDLMIAVVIAVVSATTASAAWRASMVSSAAGDAIRQGLIDAVKQQTSSSIDWGRTYEVAGYAQTYAITLAQVEAFENSTDKTTQDQAKNLRQYLLPNLQLLGKPLTTDARYLKPDGTYDLELFFADLEAESPDLSNLNPQASFTLSDQYSKEQLWLTVGVILLAISLFWLALSQLSIKQSRLPTFVVGVGIYLFGLVWFGLVEIIFFVMRGGVL
jgi:type II secretory pathway pseudopilin PulG